MLSTLTSDLIDLPEGMAMRSVGTAIVSLAAAAALGACVTTPPSSPPTATPLPVTDLESLVGQWEGLGQGPATGSLIGGHDADWVEFTIKRDGTYEARSYREIGEFRGSGRLTLSDNVVHWKSDRGSGVLYLVYDQGGKRVLRLQGQTRAGGSVWAELTPAR